MALNESLKIRLSLDLRQALEIIATKEGRSLADVIRRLLIEATKECRD